MVTWFPMSTLAGKPDSSVATVEMTAWSCTFVTAPIFTLFRSPVCVVYACGGVGMCVSAVRRSSPASLECTHATLDYVPLMTAPYHTEVLSQSSTSPTTVAEGATKALGETLGRWSNRFETCRCRDPVRGVEDGVEASEQAGINRHGAAMLPAPPPPWSIELPTQPKGSF